LGSVYELQNKENKNRGLETLIQSRFGTSFTYAGSNKLTMNGEVSFFIKTNSTVMNTPVGFKC
jgi:hypothetical protein